jgi:PAS domain S-box-containing protein
MADKRRHLNPAPEPPDIGPCVEWWRRVMSAVPFYVMLVDEDHEIVSYNRAVQDCHGQSDLCGQHCPQAIHNVDGVFPGCPLELSVQTGESQEVELFDAEKETWTASAIFPTDVLSPKGKRLFLHSARDITEHKLAAERLDQSLELHMALGLLLRELQRAASEEDALTTLLELALELSWMGGATGAVAFLRDGDDLRLVASRGTPPDLHAKCDRIRVGECICGRTAATVGADLFTVHEDQQPVRGGDHHDHSHASLALVHEGKALGVVTFYLRNEYHLDEHQRAFLLSAAQATAASVAERASNREAREARERAAMLERRLLERVIASQEEERGRIARELHDDLGQGLSALLLELQSPAAAELPARLKEALDQSIRGIIERLYRLAWDLRPAVLDDLGLYAALSRYITRTVELTGLAIDYDYIGSHDRRLPPEVELCLYRLAQEAVTNVIKHAEASHASVLVFQHPQSISLLVEDDGRGFDEVTPAAERIEGGLGMRGMHERAALLHGQLVVESTPGEGTSVRVTLPLPVHWSENAQPTL